MNKTLSGKPGAVQGGERPDLDRHAETAGGDRDAELGEGCLVELRIDPSVGSVGDSYDNALAESIIGLFKAEVINFLGPWKSIGQVEWETLKWVNWYNTERLHSAIEYTTPLEAEEAFYANLNALDKVA